MEPEELDAIARDAVLAGQAFAGIDHLDFFTPPVECEVCPSPGTTLLWNYCHVCDHRGTGSLRCPRHAAVIVSAARMLGIPPCPCGATCAHLIVQPMPR
jgi:hypothetical protein